MSKIRHIFTDIVIVLFVVLLIVLFLRHQKKDVLHDTTVMLEIDSMFAIIKKQDSAYQLLSNKKDTITIFRERIVTTVETNKINELKKELEYWKGRNSINIDVPYQKKDPLELYTYFNEIIKSKQ